MSCTNWKTLAGVLGICAAVLAAPAHATIYTIDSSLSSLTVSVSTTGVPLTVAQFAGSDTTSLSGTVDATVGGGNITFTDTNNVVFANQASDVFPGVGGGSPSAGTTSVLPDAPGTGAGNYGLTFIVPGDPGDPDTWLVVETSSLAGYAAIRDAIASINGVSALAGGTFDASTLNVATFFGNLDYNLNQNNGDGTGTPFLNGNSGIGGNSGLNSLAGLGTLVGNVLTIPINVDVQVDTGLLVLDAVFSGTIVATAVPEPSTFALAGLSLIGLIPMIRRRLRKA